MTYRDLNKTGLENWTDGYKDISAPRGQYRGEPLYIHPFGNPVAMNTEIHFSGNTWVDFARYLIQINRLLPWQFVLMESLACGISRVGTCPRIRGYEWKWMPDIWGYMQQNEFGVEIHLNPDLNRRKVAEAIRQKYGVDIAPREIYFWIWFHEVGHTFSKKTKEYFGKYSTLDWVPPMTRPASPDELMKAERANDDLFSCKEEAEREANEFARMRFAKWKNEKMNLPAKRMIDFLRPILALAAEH